jgi:ATP-dependent Zn protease
MTSFKEQQREQARPMAYHEAGHLCVAEHLGFKTDGMILDPRGPLGADGGAKLILEEELKTVEQICDYLRRRIKVLFAGSIAEAVVFEKEDFERAGEILKNQGADDCRKAIGLIHLLCNITLPLDQNDESGRKAITDNLWRETIELVEEIKEQIGSRAESELEAQFPEPD